MKNWYWYFLIVLLIIGFSFSFVFSADITLIPKPKIINLKGTEATVGPRSQIIISKIIDSKFKAAVNSFKSTLTVLPAYENNLSITAGILSEDIKKTLTDDIILALGHREGYIIEIKGDGIKIIGADELGTLHGLATLEKLITNNKGKIPQGRIMDWPDHKTRALHLVLRMTKPEDIKQLIKSGRFGHYNTLVLALADGVRLSTMEKIARDDAWTKDEFSNVVAFARENGIDIVPEVKLLSHQDKLFKDKYPSLMFNKSTYDPRKEETYAVMFPMIDEVIDLIKPSQKYLKFSV